MLEVIILAGVSGVLFINFGKDLYLKNKLGKQLNNLKLENKCFKDNLNNLHEENTKLSSINDKFECELEDLKNICSLVGKNNKDTYDRLLTLYKKHKNIVEIETRILSLKILLDLDDNSDFKLDDKERKAAKIKLQMLFKNQKIDISEECFSDFTKLQRYIERLLVSEELSMKSI